MPKQTFDVGSLLRDEGLALESGLGNGLFRVRLPNGEAKTFDVGAYAKDNGLDPKDLDFQVNDPRTAIDISPVGIVDRAKLVVGNAAGKLDYLKKKFDDVKYDKEKGLVVNNKGVWQSIDPAGLGGGDAWEMTKELARDVVDVSNIAGSALASGTGAALGMAAGPAGAIAGAGLGGGLAEGIRTSLGRLAGTYSATPQEQLQDVGIEALLNLGGEGVALGAKASLKMVGKAFSNIATNASDISKDLLSESLGRMTGAGPQATRTMIDQSEAVVSELNKAKVGSRSLNDIVEKLRSEQLGTAQAVLEEAPKALTRRFGQLKSELVQSAKDIPNVNLGQIATDSMKVLEDAGLLKREINEATGKSLFKVMDEDTAIAMRNSGKAAEILAPNIQQELQPIINQFNKFSNMGEFSGEKAAANLMDLKRTVNDVYRDVVGPATSPSVKALMDRVKSSFSNNIGKVFSDANLTPQYMSTVNLYQTYADAVGMARRMANQENGAELFVKKIVSDSGANRTLKDLAAQLADLMGPKGADQLNTLTTKEAAKAFTPWVPRTGFAAQAATAGAVGLGAYSAGTGDSNAGLGAAGIALLASPAVARNSLVYGRKTLGLIQSLNPAQRIELLRNPSLLETMIRTSFTAPIEQEKMAQQLTQQAGSQ